MQVDQELARLLAETLDQTDELLSRGEVPWEVALEGVETVAGDLALRFPGHEAYIRARVDAWIRGHAH
ncbi:MAG TPA: hypothetical protein VIG55_07765 [Methylosinus sp.]